MNRGVLLLNEAPESIMETRASNPVGIRSEPGNTSLLHLVSSVSTIPIPTGRYPLYRRASFDGGLRNIALCTSWNPTKPINAGIGCELRHCNTSLLLMPCSVRVRATFKASSEGGVFTSSTATQTKQGASLEYQAGVRYG